MERSSDRHARRGDAVRAGALDGAIYGRSAAGDDGLFWSVEGGDDDVFPEEWTGIAFAAGQRRHRAVAGELLHGVAAERGQIEKLLLIERAAPVESGQLAEGMTDRATSLDAETVQLAETLDGRTDDGRLRDIGGHVRDRALPGEKERDARTARNRVLARRV